jgi:hypothetical protein
MSKSFWWFERIALVENPLASVLLFVECIYGCVKEKISSRVDSPAWLQIWRVMKILNTDQKTSARCDLAHYVLCLLFRYSLRNFTGESHSDIWNNLLRSIIWWWQYKSVIPVPFSSSGFANASSQISKPALEMKAESIFIYFDFSCLIINDTKFDVDTRILINEMYLNVFQIRYIDIEVKIARKIDLRLGKNFDWVSEGRKSIIKGNIARFNVDTHIWIYYASTSRYK